MRQQRTVQNKAKHVKADDSGLSPADKALMDGKWKQAAQLIAKEEEVPVYKDLVTESDILTTLSRLSGIPVQKLTQTDAKKYLNLEAELHKRVIGQDQAVSALAVRFAATSQEFAVTSVRLVPLCS